VQLVQNPVAVAALHCQNSPAAIARARSEKTGETRPDMAGQHIDQKCTNQLNRKLKEDIEHRPVTMALSGNSAKAGKVSANPMGGG
jgi:hypothetical protein